MSDIASATPRGSEESPMSTSLLAEVWGRLALTATLYVTVNPRHLEIADRWAARRRAVDRPSRADPAGHSR